MDTRMDHSIGIKLNNGVLSSISCDSGAEMKESLPDRSSFGTDLTSSHGGSVVTCDLDRAVAALENSVSKSDYTDNDLSLRVQASNTQDTSTPERGISSSSMNDDNEQPLRTRNFNELIAIFSQSNGSNESEDVPSSNRATSPGLDLTPVREQPWKNNVTALCERDEMRSGITDSNDRHTEDNSLVSRMRMNFETESTINNTVLEHSHARKPVSFEVSLEDCVTRDCVTRDSREDLPSVQNGHETVRNNASSELSCMENDISTNFGISHRGKHPSTTGNPSELSSSTGSPSDESRNISSTTGSPSHLSKSFSSATGSPSDVSRSFSSTTGSSLTKSVSFEVSFDDEPVCTSVKPKTSTPTRTKQDESNAIKDTHVSPCLSKETDRTQDFLSQKSCSFDISFDDDSPKKSSPKRQHKNEFSKKSTPDKVAPSRGIADRKTDSPQLIDSSSLVNTTPPPRSLSFEINFEREQITESPQRSPENNAYSETNNFLAQHEFDALPRKGPKDKEMLRIKETVASPPYHRNDLSPEKESNEVEINLESRTELHNTEVGTPLAYSQRDEESHHDLLPEKESKEVEVSLESRTELHSTEVEKPPAYSQRDEESHGVDENISTTRGISFDVSFHEDLHSRKTKLAAKYIRLKKTKTKKQQNLKTQKQPDSVTLRTENIGMRINKSVEMRRDRDTYTLDEVSQTLQNACETGLTLDQALDNLSMSHDPTHGEHLKTCEHNTTTSKRGTYSLDQVSDCLVDAADKGLTVDQALDSLASSQETNGQLQGGKVELSPKRGTYDLDDVSRKIDGKKEKGKKSMEEALVQLLDEVESTVRSRKAIINRGTYDLEDVSQAVQHHSDQGIPVEESLNRIAESADSSSGLNTTSQVKSSSTLNTCEGRGNFSSETKEHDSEKRGTYSLDEVAERLESASEKGKSVTETLKNISNDKAKDNSEYIETSRSKDYSPSRNTYTLDEVAQSLELAKSKGIPVVQALNNISLGTSSEDLSTPGSRGTYPLDEVAHSIESARNKGLPVVLALENLVMHGGGSLRGPTEVAVYRRQGKLTNRKTYALASPLETIGEENQLRLFDGTSRKFLPPSRIFDSQPAQQESGLSAGAHVVQTLDLLTSACEALLKTSPKSPGIESEENSQSKVESRDSGVSFQSTGSERGTYSLDDVSESLKQAKNKGIPVVDALESLTAPKPVKSFRIPRAIRKGGSKSDSNLNVKSTAKEGSARQTYSLEGVSSSVEAATAKGIPVIAALDELTNSLAQFSATGAKALKNGKKPIKKPVRPSILRKREAARLERSGIKSAVGRELERQTGIPYPISYPPAMRNSYSLDDVASAFEMAYQTGASFQDVLDGKITTSQQSTGDTAATRSTESLKTGVEEQQLQDTRVIKPHVPAILPTSNSDGQISSYLRKDSGSSEGSFSCSSGSIKDSSSAEDLVGGKVTRKQRKHSNGPFQLRRTRRNSPANRRKLDVSPSSSHGDSVESVTSLGSEPSGSDTNLTKRGTYDLKKVSEELDSFKVKGVPIVKGLDKLNTNSSADRDSSKYVSFTPKRGTYSLDDLSQSIDHGGTRGLSVAQSLESFSKGNTVRKSIDSGITTEESPEQSRQDPTKNISLVLDSPPKRGTYSLEDISKKLDSLASGGTAVNKALLELSQDSPASGKGTRNTFTLDHVEVSIEDASKRGVPIVDVLDKLSTSDDQLSNKRKPFAKPQWQGSAQGEFFIEYFPPKTETKSPKFKLKNGEAVEVTAEGTEHNDAAEIKEGHLSKMHSEKIPDEVVQPSEFDLHGEKHVQVSSTSLSESQDQTSSDSTRTDTATRDGNVHVQELQDTASQSSSSAKDSGLTEASDSSTPRPRWQRSGSYVEALDSFEEMLESEQDPSKDMLILTCPNDHNQSDEIPVRDSQYQSEAYDVMLPETTSGGRSTWRPSDSVLDQILSLMDDAEENGLSIADALEQAADMSEQQGEIEESITNDVGDDTATPQHLTLLRLQFEEKRRQIEAEKRRSQEQWEEERRRLGETAFWYTIGRAQGGDKDSTIGRAQGGDKDAVNVRPGHERVPNHEPLSPGQPTPPIGRSTPLESMSPLQIKTSYQIPTVEGYQSPRGDSVHTQPTIGHGYHQAPFHRPGHQSPSQSGYQSPAQSGYQSPAQSDYQSPVTSGGFQFPSQPASTNFQHDHHNNVHEQEYETHEFRLSDNPPQLHTQQNTPPSQPSPNQNGPMKSPSRKCWDVNPAAPPSPTTAFTPTSPEGEALHVEDVQEEQGGGDNQYDDAADVQNKKGFSMFIGDESEKPKPKEGLTPEQQKKRERFLRSRQKKQEEEKTRRDAENEKKKLREVKHKEVEEQKRHEVEQREEQQRRMKLSRERLAPSNGGESTYRPWPGTNQQDDHSSFAEFSGPRCYVKPSGKSNRKLITNAISHVCLSGTVNKENKEKCLQALADSSGIHFIVLFKDGLKFRGLYMLNPETEQGFKVFGIGPKVISSKMVDCVYKYSSGGKEFVKIPSKSLSISVDGVAIQKTYWQPNKPNVASKTQSNLKRPPRPPQR